MIGPGGAGKTTLVRDYVENTKCSLKFEINSEFPSSIEKDLEKLASFIASDNEDLTKIKMICEMSNKEEKKRIIAEFMQNKLKYKKTGYLYLIM